VARYVLPQSRSIEPNSSTSTAREPQPLTHGFFARRRYNAHNENGLVDLLANEFRCLADVAPVFRHLANGPPFLSTSGHGLASTIVFCDSVRPSNPSDQKSEKLKLGHRPAKQPNTSIFFPCNPPQVRLLFRVAKWANSVPISGPLSTFSRSTLWGYPPRVYGTFRDKAGHFQSQSRKIRSDFATRLVNRNCSPRSTRRTQSLRQQQDLSPSFMKFIPSRPRTAIPTHSPRFLRVLCVLCGE